MMLSNHARIRMQQRGIPERVLDWLLAFGAVDHPRGAEVYFFDRKARRALARHVGDAQLVRYDKALDAYAVCTDGQVITVGHRYQRIVRH